MLILKEEEGYTLIIVLWSIVILTIIFSYLLDDFFLDGYLVEGYSQQQKLKEAALSVYNIGLNLLLNDETTYDTESDDWTKEISGNINEISYTLNIKDVGSRINLNYDNLNILSELDDWDGDIEEIAFYLEEDILSDILFLRDVLDDNNYQVLSRYTTTYGNYNINHDPPRKTKKVFRLLGLEYAFTDSLIDSLISYREEEDEIEDLDELLHRWDGFGISVFDEIKPYLSLDGRININLVNENILQAIFKSYDLDSNLVENVIEFREENKIINIEDLSFLLSSENFKKIKGFFTTHSKFLELDIYVEIAEIKGYSLKSIVKRTYQEDKWLAEVFSWVEKEIFPEVIKDGDEEI